MEFDFLKDFNMEEETRVKVKEQFLKILEKEKEEYTNLLEKEKGEHLINIALESSTTCDKELLKILLMNKITGKDFKDLNLETLINDIKEEKPYLFQNKEAKTSKTEEFTSKDLQKSQQGDSSLDYNFFQKRLDFARGEKNVALQVKIINEAFEKGVKIR